MKRYVCVCSDSEMGLNEYINQYLKRGWKLQGGVSCCVYEQKSFPCKAVYMFSQSMFKESDCIIQNKTFDLVNRYLMGEGKSE